MAISDNPQKKPLDELENWNLDKTVEPWVMARGMMVKRSGAWEFWSGDVEVVDSLGNTTGFITDQVSILSSGATQIIASNTLRKKGVVITNHSSQDVYLGTSAVTTSTGVLLRGIPGANICIPSISAVYGIVSATGQTISYIEI